MGGEDDDLVEAERKLNRFRRLLGEVIQGSVRRTAFEPWEVEILLDLEACQIEPKRRHEISLQYLRCVEKQMETGPGPPMRLSEFLQRKNTRRPSNE